MDKVLTKYFWVLNIVTLVVIAYLLATGSGELIATEVRAELPTIEAKTAVVKRAKTPKKTVTQLSAVRDGSPILTRNIFDSAVGPIDPDGFLAELDDPELPPSIDGLPIVPCSNSKIKLLATVASKELPDWSFASINQGSETRLCRIGDEIDGRVVSRIFWKYLFLRGSSDECYIGLFDEGKPVKAPTRPAVGKPIQVGKTGSDDIKNGIHFISENERAVDRTLIDKLIANPSQFVRSVRVRPYREGGKVVGFKLRRFKPDSPLALLGAKKGDIIRSVNGIDLTSVDKALGAYQSLRSASSLKFSLTRQGKPVDLSVSIR